MKLAMAAAGDACDVPEETGAQAAAGGGRDSMTKDSRDRDDTTELRRRVTVIASGRWGLRAGVT